MRSKYTESASKGLGGRSRAQLGELLRRTMGTVSPEQAARVLKLQPGKAAKLLSRWASQGWLARVRRGLYVPVPLESQTADVALEDSWLVAERLFSPCYIGGWSAAEHWGLTEQIYRTVLVFTVRKPRNRAPVLRGASFQLRSIREQALFGLKPVWRGRVRVNVSDPSRTVVDMLSDPALGGGLRSTVDVLRAYLGSPEFRNLKLLQNYAERLGNGAVFKRLGFLLERYAPTENDAIAFCRARLSQGNAKLDPPIQAKRLASAWRLWLPAGWDKVQP
ncbi:MAG: type IV toxin-antitoxin system AbiEi family antitoxin domain-containing protein [Gammaproteobacteria bacterium]